jgi:hypothetical protein
MSAIRQADAEPIGTHERNALEAQGGWQRTQGDVLQQIVAINLGLE